MGMTFYSAGQRASQSDLTVSVSPLGLVELADEEFEVHEYDARGHSQAFDYIAHDHDQFNGHQLDPNGAKQGRLFMHSETPAVDVIDYMKISKEHRIHAMTAIGMAQNESLRRTGRDVQASTNLSDHSNHLVENIQGKGMAAGAERRQRNEMTFDVTPKREFFEAPTLSNDEVAAGRRTGRAIASMRKKDSSPPRSQGRQQELF